MEGYHLNATHPKTIRPRSPTEMSEYVPGNDYFSAYRLHCKPGLPEPGSTSPGSDQIDPVSDENRFSFVFNVFPNLVVSSNAHRTMYICVRPQSAGRVALR